MIKQITATLAAAAVIGLGSAARAQTIEGGWEFRVSNVVSPSQPTTTVEVWAWFDFVPGVSELFTSGNFDLVASEGEWLGGFVFPLLRPDPGPTIRGSSIIGMIAWQPHIPSLGFYGDPANPIHVFSADWTTSNPHTPRTIDLRTENTTYFYVVDQAGNLTQLFPQGFVPASGMIIVIPSPASLTAAVVGFAACTIPRDRRRASQFRRPA